MAQERRTHPRYEPEDEISVRLAQATGAGESTGRLNHLAEAGCCLMMVAPPRGGKALVAHVPLGDGGPDLEIACRMTGRLAMGPAWQVSLVFETPSIAVQARLKAALVSDAFRPVGPEAPPASRKHWRVEQWAAFLAAQETPVMARSKFGLTELEARAEAPVSAREMADLAQGDPFLCLRLLREAESRRTERLGHETTTPLAAVMQIGEEAFAELLLSSAETDESVEGLAACEARAVAAGNLAAAWSSARADVSPDELVMGCLLSEIGELLLWHFAPELPGAALEALADGEASRSAEAQELRCGFKFKDLTLTCAEIWSLPGIVVQLIRGTDNVRARLAQVCIDTARHLAADPDNPALPDDLAGARLLIPGASIGWLASWLTAVPEDRRPALLERAEAAYARRQKDEAGGSPGA